MFVSREIISAITQMHLGIQLVEVYLHSKSLSEVVVVEKKEGEVFGEGKVTQVNRQLNNYMLWKIYTMLCAWPKVCSHPKFCMSNPHIPAICDS